MKILVIGSLNIDLVAQVDRFPNEGETLFGKGLTQLIGGKGANQASSAVKQDVFVTMWGVVGNDAFGTHIIDNVKKLNINSQIQVGSQSTGTALIERDARGKNRIIVIPGANGEFTKDVAVQNLHLLDEHDIIVMQFEIPMPTIEFLAQEAKKRNKIVIINPAPAIAMSEELLHNVDYLVPNEHELSIITGKPTDSFDQIKSAVQTLMDKDIPYVLTTLGEKGIYLATKEEEHIIKAYPVKVIDTTGAGDAFIGGFAGALAKKMNIIDAVNHANKVAGISVTRVGAFASAGSYDEVKNF